MTPISIRSTFVPLFGTVLALAACGPSIDPAAKADIDRRVGALQAGTAAVPAPTVFEPMPLAAGQWSQYKMVDDKGQPSFLTYKIVGEEGGAYWLEMVHETYSGRMVQKMLVAFGSRTDPGQIENPRGQDQGHQGKRQRAAARDDAAFAVDL